MIHFDINIDKCWKSLYYKAREVYDKCRFDIKEVVVMAEEKKETTEQEIRQKLFRAPAATIDALDEWAKARGLKGTDVLPAIQSALALADKKAQLAGRGGEIEHFSSLVRQLTNAYVESLDQAADAANVARDEVADEIAGLRTQVFDQQERITALKADRAAAASAQADADAARVAVEKKLSQLTDSLAAARGRADDQKAEYETRLSEKDALISTLTKAQEKAEAETAAARVELASVDELKRRHAAEVEKLKEQMAQAVAEARGGMQERVEAAKERAAAQVAAAQAAAESAAAKAERAHLQEVATLNARIVELETVLAKSTKPKEAEKHGDVD